VESLTVSSVLRWTDGGRTGAGSGSLRDSQSLQGVESAMTIMPTRAATDGMRRLLLEHPDPLKRTRRIEVKTKRDGVLVWSRTSYTLARPPAQ
jgi:hypothetical protein